MTSRTLSQFLANKNESGDQLKLENKLNRKKTSKEKQAKFTSLKLPTLHDDKILNMFKD